MPNFSMSAAANGAVNPKRMRFVDTAAEMVAVDQPNSSCNGWIRTPGVARKPAAPTSATSATAATDQAGCTLLTRTVFPDAGREDEWPGSHCAQESSHEAVAPSGRRRPRRGGRVRPRDARADLRLGPRRRRHAE